MDKITTFLMSSPWILTGVAVVAAGLVMGIYYLVERRKQGKHVIKDTGTKKVVEKEGKKAIVSTTIEKYERVYPGKGIPNAEIVDPVHRKIGLYSFTPIQGKDYGRVINVNGRDLFSLRIAADGSLEQLVHSKSMENPPSEVYRAIHTKDKVREVFGSSDDNSDKLRLGLLVAGGIIALFIMFMAVWEGANG